MGPPATRSQDSPPEKPDVLEHVCRYDVLRGIVLECFGSGNMPDILEPVLAEAAKRLPVVITSSVFDGSVEDIYMVSALSSVPDCISGGRFLLHTAEMWLRRFLGECRNLEEIRQDFKRLHCPRLPEERK